MLRSSFAILAAALLLPGCVDGEGPHDLTPPAAPRGVYSVTGDGWVMLRWLANTEGDVAGYNVYVAPCASGADCPYERVGTTGGTLFTVHDLPNGVTQYYAVAAFDRAGNESDLSYEEIHDTPRPAGTGAVLSAFQDQPESSGWDFSTYGVRAWDDPRTDIYFSSNGTFDEMLTPDPALTSIQDMGFAPTLDAVDFAPPAGWSPTGSVELIVGHNYVVWTADDHYAKFRVTSLGGHVVFDWAYQIDRANGELRGRPAGGARANRGLTPAAGPVTPVKVLTRAGVSKG
jgi:hypothetical protein